MQKDTNEMKKKIEKKTGKREADDGGDNGNLLSRRS